MHIPIHCQRNITQRIRITNPKKGQNDLAAGPMPKLRNCRPVLNAAKILGRDTDVCRPWKYKAMNAVSITASIKIMTAFRLA